MLEVVGKTCDFNVSWHKKGRVISSPYIFYIRFFKIKQKNPEYPTQVEPLKAIQLAKQSG